MDEKITVSFDAAKIKKFETKDGKMGITLGQLVLEIESENAFQDFAMLHKFKAGTYLHIVISTKPDHKDSGYER